MKLKLHWVTTPDHDEDWFIVAANRKQAEIFHEQNEGYLPGDATAEEIMTIPDTVTAETGWPSEELLLALGAKFLEDGPARVVVIGDRKFCEGLLEETIRSLSDDCFEANGEQRLNGTIKISKRLN